MAKPTKKIKCRVCREVIEDKPPAEISVASKRAQERICWVCSHLQISAGLDSAFDPQT